MNRRSLNFFSARRFIGIYSVVVLGFMVAPIVVVIGASFSENAYLSFPPGQLSTRWYSELVHDSSWLDAAKTSLLLATTSTLISLALGTASAFAVASRRAWRGSEAYSGIMLLPLIFPFTATGVAIVATLGTWHLIGTFRGFLIAHVLVTLPYSYRAMLVSIRRLKRSYFEAALMNGANEVQAFWRVVIPTLRPGIATAGIFSFLLSFDETTISMLLPGPHITTLPVKMFATVVDGSDPTVAAVATANIAIVTILLLGTQRLFGLRLFTENY